MRAGTLRHRLRLQSLVVGRDEIGQATQTWDDGTEVWADIRYLNGLETVKSDAPIDVTRCSIRIRWRSGVDAGMRAIQGARVFDIKAVLPDETGRRYIDLVAEFGANQG